MTDTIITAIASGLVAIIVSLITISVAWKKAPAETAAVYQDIANKQGENNAKLVARMDELQNRVDELECKIQDRDRLIAEWQVGITRLIEQLEEHKLTPVWRPRAIKVQENHDTTRR